MTNSNLVYDIAEWIVYNIEDLCLQYVEIESPLPLEIYLMNRAVMAFKDKEDSIEVRAAFGDNRIQTIINFYSEDRDEFEDQVH